MDGPCAASKVYVIVYRTSDFRFCMNASSLLTWVTCFSHWRSRDLYLGTFKDSCEIHTISTFSFGLWEKGRQLTMLRCPLGSLLCYIFRLVHGYLKIWSAIYENLFLLSQIELVNLRIWIRQYLLSFIIQHYLQKITVGKDIW